MSYFEKLKLTSLTILLILVLLLGIWVLHQGLSQVSQELRVNNKKLDQISTFNIVTNTISSARE